MNRYYWQVYKYNPSSKEYEEATEVGNNGKIPTGSIEFTISERSTIKQFKLYDGSIAYLFPSTTSTGNPIALEFSPLSSDLDLFSGFKNLQNQQNPIKIYFHYENPNAEYPEDCTDPKWDYYEGYISNVSLRLLLSGKEQKFVLRVELLPAK